MQSGKVSILIPNFNKEIFLRKTLDSIVSQVFTNWDCIIVDDGSTDNSLDILRSYAQNDSRIQVFERPAEIPKGANFCRNHAFSLAKGEFIQWFDSDDIMFPWYLKGKVDYLQANPTTHFVVTKGEIKFQEGFEGNTKFAQNYVSSDPIEDYVRFRLLFLTGGPLARRSVYDTVGLFNIKLRRHQEWELYLRMVLHYYSWGTIDKPGFCYFVNDNSITSRHQNKARIVESELVLFQEVLSIPEGKFTHSISKKTKIRFAMKYFLVATYHKRFRYSFWYFTSLLKEMGRYYA